eukprot:147407_1
MFAKRIGVNYENMGNTCFMDSSMNLYASDPNVVDIQDCKCQKCLNQEFCTLRCLHDTLKQQQTNPIKLKPNKMFVNIQKINAECKYYDEGEFLQSMLDKVSDAIINQPKAYEPLSTHKVNTPSFILAEVIVTTCSVCKSTRTDTTKQCQIVLPVNKHKTIIQCLKTNQRIEVLDGENKAYCYTKCFRKTKSTRKIHYRVRNTLYLVLNR